MFYHDVQKPRILFENHLTNNTASDLVPTLIAYIRVPLELHLVIALSCTMYVFSHYIPLSKLLSTVWVFPATGFHDSIYYICYFIFATCVKITSKVLHTPSSA